MNTSAVHVNLLLWKHKTEAEEFSDSICWDNIIYSYVIPIIRFSRMEFVTFKKHASEYEMNPYKNLRWPIITPSSKKNYWENQIHKLYVTKYVNDLRINSMHAVHIRM